MFGNVSGSIRSKRVMLHSTARVEGDIFHQGIGIEMGTRYDGTLKWTEDPGVRIRGEGKDEQQQGGRSLTHSAGGPSSSSRRRSKQHRRSRLSSRTAAVAGCCGAKSAGGLRSLTPPTTYI